MCASSKVQGHVIGQRQRDGHPSVYLVSSSTNYYQRYSESVTIFTVPKAWHVTSATWSRFRVYRTRFCCYQTIWLSRKACLQVVRGVSSSERHAASLGLPRV